MRYHPQEQSQSYATNQSKGPNFALLCWSLEWFSWVEGMWPPGVEVLSGTGLHEPLCLLGIRSRHPFLWADAAH